LENRIDEIYSLTEFINPHVFGSLFRFNRDFYTFDDRGRVSGLKNMRQLHERFTLVMLRRRKDQIADQLPQRVDNNYFVKMSPSQQE
jgi:SNF2 family DNA or RNA helicase